MYRYRVYIVWVPGTVQYAFISKYVLVSSTEGVKYIKYYKYSYMKGGNPKGAFWDDVVTYWNFDEYIEIYINITICLSNYEYFQFKCDNINFTLNLPMSGHRPKFSILDFRPSYITLLQYLVSLNRYTKVPGYHPAPD